jgi:hypothetical protein
MAMIAVKKGIILRTIGEQPSNPTIRMLRDDLRSFHEDMPSGMTLNHLTLSSGIPSDLRRIVFYMHLFYMSALMLLYRLILRHTDGVDYLTSAHVCPHEAQKAAGEGLLAAKTAARILHLLLTEGSVVRICWLSM